MSYMLKYVGAAPKDDTVLMGFNVYQNVCNFVGHTNTLDAVKYMDLARMGTNFEIPIVRGAEKYVGSTLMFMVKNEYQSSTIKSAIKPNHNVKIIVTSRDHISQISNFIKALKTPRNILVCNFAIFISLNHENIPRMVKKFENEKEYNESENFGFKSNMLFSLCTSNDTLVIKHNILNDDQLLPGNIIILRGIRNQTSVSMITEN